MAKRTVTILATCPRTRQNRPVRDSMPDLVLEQSFCERGFVQICGVDEAGRGPWAGPVVAAAVNLAAVKADAGLIGQLNDSKKLPARHRIRLFEALVIHADTAVGIAGVDEIDTHNILNATLCAMRRAVDRLRTPPEVALVDGNREPVLSCAVRTVVRGDSRSASIAAASIVAKVTRDRIMSALATQHPGYGWERNAGYGTAEHRAALEQRGITPHHRRSFKPVRRLVEGSIS